MRSPALSFVGAAVFVFGLILLFTPVHNDGILVSDRDCGTVLNPIHFGNEFAEIGSEIACEEALNTRRAISIVLIIGGLAVGIVGLIPKREPTPTPSAEPVSTTAKSDDGRDPSASDTTEAPASARLAELNRMKELGAITDDEYAAKRQSILDEL